MQLERRGDLAHGGRARFKAGLPACRCLPAQVKSDKSQGVRGTASPDSSNQTLQKPRQLVSIFLGGNDIILKCLHSRPVGVQLLDSSTSYPQLVLASVHYALYASVRE
jgi:hypothetical protein